MTKKIEMTFKFKNAKHVREMLKSFQTLTGNDTDLLIYITLSGDFEFATPSIENELYLREGKVTGIGSKYLNVYVPSEKRAFLIKKKLNTSALAFVKFSAPNFNRVEVKHLY